MRRVPAILLVLFLACPLFFSAFTVISVSTWALNRGFYVEIIGDTGLYEIPDAVSSATWLDLSERAGLDVRASGRALREILSPSYMRDQAVSLVNQVFDTLEGRARTADFTVDLTPVKTALLGEPGKKFARALAEELPVGGTDFRVGPGRLPHSRPSSVSVEKAAQLILQGLPTFVGSLPDSARLSDANRYYGWRMWPRVSVPGILIMAGVVLLLFAAGIWVAAAFVGGATQFERLQWLGWSLLAPAAGVLLTGLAVAIGGSAGWMQWALHPGWMDGSGLSESFATAVMNVARHVLSRVATGFLATGAIAGGIAMGLLAWSWSIPEGERKPPAA